MPILAAAFGRPDAAKAAKFFMVEEAGIGRDHPFSGEKLIALTVYRARDSADAKRLVGTSDHQGCHLLASTPPTWATPASRRRTLDVVRAGEFRSTPGNGGGLDSGLASITRPAEELDLREPELPPFPEHHLQDPEDKPPEEELFALKVRQVRAAL